MQRKSWPILMAAFSVAVLLGGCLGGSGDPVVQQAPPDPRAPVVPEFGEETGAIQGIVVDEELRPVPRATVQINETGASTTANEIGSFGFSYVEPGTYTLWATRDGYLGAATTVQVIEGTSTDARLVVAVDMSNQTYHLDYEFRGFWSCSVAIVVGVPNCNGLGVHAFGQQEIAFAFDTFSAWNESMIELRWEYASVLAATTPGAFFSNQANSANETRCLGDVHGEQSPIVKRFRPGDEFGGENCSSVVANYTGLVPDGPYRHTGFFQPWGMMHNETQPVIDLFANAHSRGVGIAFNQHFAAWFSVFYRMEAPIDYTAFPDE